MRKLLLKLHLWTSLITALPMIVVAVTGALLVYGEEIDHAVDRRPGADAPATSPLREELRASCI